jgi:hypothetical protein
MSTNGWMKAAWIPLAVLGAVAGIALARGAAATEPTLAMHDATVTVVPHVVVYKSATCGCCSKWIDHLNANGFHATGENRDDMAAIKKRHGITSKLSSCHTALVDGYVIEGHVPADLIQRLLEEKPAGVVGLAAPGMPAGSPGMETPGGTKDSYEILAIHRDGSTHVFARR